MSDDLISKKDLLDLKGISYGQLYILEELLQSGDSFECRNVR